MARGLALGFHLCSSAFICGSLCFAGQASEIARAVNDTALDPDECYRVHEVTIARQDARFYLTDGYLIFSKPVAGRRILAAFTSDVESGDAEVLLMPPNRSERRSLASYTGSPNMDEHFEAAVFVFSDDTYAALTEQFRNNSFNRKIPELGAIIAEKWSLTARDIARSFETRLVLDLLAPGPGFFAAALRGRQAGNFDVTYDPQAPEQMVVGQIAYHDGRPYLDIWTSFEARSFRTGKLERPLPPYALRDFRIQATVDEDLVLRVNTKVKLKPERAGVVFPFEISPQMRVTQARIEGQPAEIYSGQSLRSNLIRNNGNDLILLVSSQPLDAAREYEVEFQGEGEVIRNAGNRVYYVGARNNWYPNSSLQFATYDLTFRYPRDLDLVTPGEVVSDRTEGDWRITRRRTGAPIRFAGFNLGEYERARISRGGYTIEVCANRRVERALEPKPVEPIVVEPPGIGRRRQQAEIHLPPTAPPPPNPTSKLQELATEVAAEVEFMAARFGPPPLRFLTVSPVPGTFGQGFPGLIYLSTLTYVAPALHQLNPRQQMFFSELLHAHETGHQWWGNVVSADGYHDVWLMEALANYTGLMFLEKRKGPRTLEAMLNEYRDNLLKKLDSGEITDSAGPVVMGPRLENSLTPDAWRYIVYGKGSWILHMLRRRMGDDKFLAMLAELRRRYEGRSVTTDAFRQLAAGFLPAKAADPKLESFFDQWVYGTGIPSLKLSWSVKGKAPALRLVGTLAQAEVSDDFSVHVPVEIQFARGKPITRWVDSSGDPVTFTVPLRQPPLKVVLDPAQSALRR